MKVIIMVADAKGRPVLQLEMLGRFSIERNHVEGGGTLTAILHHPPAPESEVQSLLTIRNTVEPI